MILLRLQFIKKTFGLFILLLAMSIIEMKAEPMKYLVINTTSGQTFIELEKQPAIVFGDQKLIINVESEVSFTTDFNNLIGFKFSTSAATSINNIEIEKCCKQGNQNHITGIKTGEVVEAFSIDGRQVAVWRADGNTMVDIDLTSFAKGIYVIKTTNSSFKIIRK